MTTHEGNKERKNWCSNIKKKKKLNNVVVCFGRSVLTNSMDDLLCCVAGV